MRRVNPAVRVREQGLSFNAGLLIDEALESGKGDNEFLVEDSS